MCWKEIASLPLRCRDRMRRTEHLRILLGWDWFGLQLSFLLTAACEVYVLYFALWGSRTAEPAQQRSAASDGASIADAA